MLNFLKVWVRRFTVIMWQDDIFSIKCGAIRVQITIVLSFKEAQSWVNLWLNTSFLLFLYFFLYTSGQGQGSYSGLVSTANQSFPPPPYLSRIIIENYIIIKTRRLRPTWNSYSLLLSLLLLSIFKRNGLSSIHTLTSLQRYTYRF